MAFVFGQEGEEVVFRLCENEGVKEGLYRRGERIGFGHLRVGLEGKVV